jgi:hypothetical protein
VLAKLWGLGLYHPLRLYRALRLRHEHGLSADVADSLGLLERPRSEHRSYAFESMRASFSGAVPPLAVRPDEEDKVRFAARMQERGLPTPTTLAILGRRQDTDAVWTGPVLESADAFTAFVRERGNLDGVCKPATGGSGWDIMAFRVVDGMMCLPERCPGPAAFFDRIQARGYARFCWILQQRETVHPELREIMLGDGLGTIRIHSALAPSGEVLLRWPTLKIPPIGSSVSDNWHSGRRGGLLVPVDLDTGTLGRAVGRDRDGARCRLFSVHPRTGAEIEGRRVPCWPAMVELVRRAARALSELPALGWDIAITPRGPVIIETNWKFGFSLPQSAQRRGLRAELAEFFAFAQTNRMPSP